MSVVATLLPEDRTCTVPMEGVESVAELLGGIHAALALSMPIEEYDVEVSGEGVLPMCGLTSLGIMGCGEEVTVRLRFKHVAREKLRARVDVGSDDAIHAALAAAIKEGDWELVALVRASETVPLAPYVAAAALEGRHDQANMLIKHGAHPDVVVRNGMSPLWQAAALGLVEMCRTLLDAGAGIDFPCLHSGTPLGIAAARGHTDVVRFLLARGADVHAAGRDGVTPMALAKDNRRSQIVAILREHGARPSPSSES